MNYLKRNEDGLTLVEVIVTISILSVVSLIIWSIFFQGVNFSEKATSKNLLIQESNILISNLTRIHQTTSEYEITSTGTDNCEITIIYESSSSDQTFKHPQMCYEFTYDIKNKKVDDPEPNKVYPDKNDLSLTLTIKDKKNPNNKVTISTYLYKLKGATY